MYVYIYIYIYIYMYVCVYIYIYIYIKSPPNDTPPYILLSCDIHTHARAKDSLQNTFVLYMAITYKGYS